MTMKFSIIIPTYNEALDIVKTLDSVVRQTYKNIETIIIDDSTDETPNIISKYKKIPINLIRPKVRYGRSEARNIGLKMAKGDVCIILNADARLPSDFIKKIKKHYDNGYQSVTPYAEVENLDNIFARYVGLHHYLKIRNNVFKKREKNLNNIWWSEGFSVKKEIAMKTDLFPSNFSVPIVAGEDVTFVNQLREIGCKGISDKNIIVKHKAPDNFSDFWKTRVGRGEGTPQIRSFVDKWSKIKIFVVISTKLFYRLFKFILILPVVLYAFELAKLSEKRFVIYEIFRMSFCWVIEQLAFSFGEFQSFFKLVLKNVKN
jgi:glycosyltransferase involved in cell wall biosynthesis